MATHRAAIRDHPLTLEVFDAIDRREANFTHCTADIRAGLLVHLVPCATAPTRRESSVANPRHAPVESLGHTSIQPAEYDAIASPSIRHCFRISGAATSSSPTSRRSKDSCPMPIAAVIIVLNLEVTTVCRHERAQQKASAVAHAFRTIVRSTDRSHHEHRRARRPVRGSQVRAATRLCCPAFTRFER